MSNRTHFDLAAGLRSSTPGGFALVAASLLLAVGMSVAPVFAQPAEHSFGTIDPAMFVARDDDTTIYLLGTLHFLPCAMDTDPPVCASGITPAVRSAVASADEVWLEIANPNEAAQDTHLGPLIALGMFHDDSMLSDYLPEEDIEFVAEILADYFDVDVATVMVGVENVMPWVLQAMLGEVLGGLDGRWSPGVDFELEDVAHELGIPVLGFETVEEQITLLASDPIEFQAVDLRSALVALRHGVDFEAVNAAGFAEMWDIWRDGRLDELAFVTQTNGEWMVDMTDAEIAAAYGVSESEYALMRSEIETFYPLEMQQGRQVVSERLLGDRNRDWMIEITGMLARPGTFFIGVGAAHLVGDAGLPALLQDAGIMVKRIE